MKIFITFGTNNHLQNIKETYPNELMLIMTSEEDQALLLHESDKETVFKEGRVYEIIDQKGQLEKNSRFAVLNNIPVSDEGRPLFEYQFKNRAKSIENEPSYVAMRILRPIKSDTYIILTLWECEKDFLTWQKQNANFYDEAQKNWDLTTEIDLHSFFSKPSYVTKYSVNHS